MTNEQQLRAFVTRFLQSSGATIQPCVDGSLAVELPPTVAESLETAPSLKLCFLRDQALDAEFITFGHPLLDRMMAQAGKRGKAASLLFAANLDSDLIHLIMTADPFAKAPTDAPRAYLRLTEVMGNLKFPNSRKRILGRRMLHQLQLLFYFRVSFASDEKREHIIPVLIDPVTEEVDALLDPAEAVSFTLPKSKAATEAGEADNRTQGQTYAESVMLDALTAAAAERLPENHYPVLRLYRKACAHLETKVADEFAAFAEESNKRLAKELSRIEEYYKGLARETLDPLRKVFRRMASLSVRTQLARSSDAQNRYAAQLHEMKHEASGLEARYEEELQQLALEKERRCNELVAKHQSRVEIHLANVAALRVPRVEYTLRLSGTERRELTFLYDILREQFVDLVCEACGHHMHEVILCTCGNVVCPNCAATCTCGRYICTDCSAGACHVCGALVCDSCNKAGCPLGATMTPEFVVCGRCRKEVCPGCTRLAQAMIDT